MQAQCLGLVLLLGKPPDSLKVFLAECHDGRVLRQGPPYVRAGRLALDQLQLDRLEMLLAVEEDHDRRWFLLLSVIIQQRDDANIAPLIGRTQVGHALVDEVRNTGATIKVLCHAPSIILLRMERRNGRFKFPTGCALSVGIGKAVEVCGFLVRIARLLERRVVRFSDFRLE